MIRTVNRFRVLMTLLYMYMFVASCLEMRFGDGLVAWSRSFVSGNLIHFRWVTNIVMIVIANTIDIKAARSCYWNILSLWCLNWCGIIISRTDTLNLFCIVCQVLWNVLLVFKQNINGRWVLRGLSRNVCRVQKKSLYFQLNIIFFFSYYHWGWIFLYIKFCIQNR